MYGWNRSFVPDMFHGAVPEAQKQSADDSQPLLAKRSRIAEEQYACNTAFKDCNTMDCNMNRGSVSEYGDMDDGLTGSKPAFLRLPELVDLLAKEGQVLRWDESACWYEVLNGPLFEEKFNALRCTRGKRKEQAVDRPFARMHTYFVLARGGRWAGTGSAFRPIGKIPSHNQASETAAGTPNTVCSADSGRCEPFVNQCISSNAMQNAPALSGSEMMTGGLPLHEFSMAHRGQNEMLQSFHQPTADVAVAAFLQDAPMKSEEVDCTLKQDSVLDDGTDTFAVRARSGTQSSSSDYDGGPSQSGGKGPKLSFMRLPELIDALAKEGHAVRWDRGQQWYEVLNGPLFEEKFNLLRHKRGKGREEAVHRPFARMHTYFVLVRGEKWAGTGSAFRLKDRPTGQDDKPAAAGSQMADEDRYCIAQANQATTAACPIPASAAVVVDSCRPSCTSAKPPATVTTDSCYSAIPAPPSSCAPVVNPAVPGGGAAISADAIKITLKGEETGMFQCSLQHFLDVTGAGDLYNRSVMRGDRMRRMSHESCSEIRTSSSELSSESSPTVEIWPDTSSPESLGECEVSVTQHGHPQQHGGYLAPQYHYQHQHHNHQSQQQQQQYSQQYPHHGGGGMLNDQDIAGLVGTMWHENSLGDQAYWFPRNEEGLTSPSPFPNGAIVALVDGRLCLAGSGQCREEEDAGRVVYMVVSDSNAKWKGEPIPPTPEEEAKGHWCAFLGQVPVRVEGRVRSGQLLGPKPGAAGVAMAVSSLACGPVVGIALASKEDDGVGMVRTLCFAGFSALSPAGGDAGGEDFKKAFFQEHKLEAEVAELRREVGVVGQGLAEVRAAAEEQGQNVKDLETRIEVVESDTKRWAGVVAELFTRGEDVAAAAAVALQQRGAAGQCGGGKMESGRMRWVARAKWAAHSAVALALVTCMVGATQWYTASAAASAAVAAATADAGGAALSHAHMMQQASLQRGVSASAAKLSGLAGKGQQMTAFAAVEAAANETVMTAAEAAVYAAATANETAVRGLIAAVAPEGAVTLGDDASLYAFLSQPDNEHLLRRPELRYLLQRPEYQHVLHKPGFMILLQEPELQHLLLTPDFSPVLMKPRFHYLLAKPEFQPLLQDPAFHFVLQRPAFQHLLRQPELQHVLLEPDFVDILKRPTFQYLLRQKEFHTVLRRPDFRYILDQPDFADLLASDADFADIRAAAAAAAAPAAEGESEGSAAVAGGVKLAGGAAEAAAEEEARAQP